MPIPNVDQFASNACRAGYVNTQTRFHQDLKQSRATVKKLGASNREFAAHLRFLIEGVGISKEVEYDAAKSIPNSTLGKLPFHPSSPKGWKKVAIIAGLVATGAFLALQIGFLITGAAVTTPIFIGLACLAVLKGLGDGLSSSTKIHRDSEYFFFSSMNGRVYGKNIISIKKETVTTISDLFNKNLNPVSCAKYTLSNKRSGYSISLYDREIDYIEKMGFFGFSGHSNPTKNVIHLYSVLTGIGVVTINKAINPSARKLH